MSIWGMYYAAKNNFAGGDTPIPRGPLHGPAGPATELAQRPKRTAGIEGVRAFATTTHLADP